MARRITQIAMLRPAKFPLQFVKRVRSAFDGEGRLFEIKHDGFRVLAHRVSGAPRLLNAKRL
jgi:ATP-dependent DNA ligase